VTDRQHNDISQVLPTTESQFVTNDHFMNHMHTLQACLFAFHSFPTGALKMPSLAELITAPNTGMIGVGFLPPEFAVSPFPATPTSLERFEQLEELVLF